MFPSSLIKSIYLQLAMRSTTLWCPWTWAWLLFLTVAVASLAPMKAFVAAVMPMSEYSRGCGKGYVRFPMELPAEGMCFPVHWVKRSGSDFLIPSIFAGLTVAGSALLLQGLELWRN